MQLTKVLLHAGLYVETIGYRSLSAAVPADGPVGLLVVNFNFIFSIGHLYQAG